MRMQLLSGCARRREGAFQIIERGKRDSAKDGEFERTRSGFDLRNVPSLASPFNSTASIAAPTTRSPSCVPSSSMLLISRHRLELGFCECRFPLLSCRMRVPMRERLSNRIETWLVGSSAESPPAGTQ